MQVRLLGPVEVRASDADPWVRPPPQQRMLLAALCAPVGRGHDAAALADALWDGRPPDNAHRLLQSLASRVRAALGQDVERDGPVRTVEGGWRLDVAPEQLDTGRFEHALGRARSLAANGDVDAARVAIDEGLALWRGRPFGDLADVSLLVAERTRLEERRLEAHTLRMQLRLAAGAHAPVIAELKELLADHPLREQLWALLMVALYQAGREAEALVAYQRVRDRLSDELGVDPGPTLQRLHGQILRRELDDRAVVLAVGDDVGPIPTPTRMAKGQTLPRPLTSFVGRRSELVALGQLVAEAPLVSVVGTGGVGKTRLALSVAEAAGPGFDLGAAFVDLSGVSADLLTKAVATAVGAVELAHQPMQDTLVDHLRRGSLLLVLDNCEQLREPVGELVGHLLAGCPDLVVLATSRERLGVAGERVFAVGPLSVHPADEAGPMGDRHGPVATSGSDAATLFLERTRAVAPGFAAPLGLVEEACRRLDGLPLAIELAAARAASLGIDGLLAGLDDRLRLLQGAPGNVGRHRSLRAVLDWSHDLLDEEERRTLRRLAPFATGFDLRAATAVLAPAADERVQDPSGYASTVADIVGRLADKSLLTPEHGHRGTRWSWLASVRDYALQKLVASGEAEAYRRRHLRWAVETAVELREQMEAGEEWRPAFREVEDDLRAALEGPPEDDAGSARVAGAASAEAGLHPDEDRLRLAFVLAALQSRTGSYTVAQRAYDTAIRLARAVGGPEDLAEAALGASVSGMTFGVSDSRRVARLEEALADHPDPGPLRVRLLARLSMELYWLVDRDRSLALVQEAVATAERLGDDLAHAHALYALHYTRRGLETIDERVRLSAEIVERADRGHATELALAARAAHVVDLLAAGDLRGMDTALSVLWGAAERLGLPAFQWYADVYRLVRALLEGRFGDADALAATSIAAGRNVAEFTVGLYFAEAITDLRDLDARARRDRATRLQDLARRFPAVLAWRCLELLDALALRHPGPRAVTSSPVRSGAGDGDGRAAAAQLVDEVLAEPLDAHWLVEACLLAEAVAELGEPALAARLEAALRPHAGSLAVAGRVAACRGGVSHALGLLDLVLDDLDRAVTDLQQAVAQHERLGALPHVARSLSVLARAHDRRAGGGDRREADELRQRARQLAHRLGTAALDGVSSTG